LKTWQSWHVEKNIRREGQNKLRLTHQNNSDWILSLRVAEESLPAWLEFTPAQIAEV
jgi:hypothetical protein